MKAIVFTRYGSPDALEWRDFEKPRPKDDEALIRIHAVSINDWDLGALRGKDLVNRLLFGLLKPRPDKQILGSDVAGRVEAVGKSVRRLKPGDDVYGDLSGRWGGFAEYVCAPEKDLIAKPAGMTFEQAAAIPQAALLALQGLRKAGPIQKGQRVLINGAGGGTGTFAMQIVKPSGAEITAVDSSDKLEMLRAMGATHVIDYRCEDFTRNGEQYDVILDVKTNRSLLHIARALRPGGTFVTVGGSIPLLLHGLAIAPFIPKKNFRVLALKPNEGLAEINELFESGKLVPVIDRIYSLGEVPDALRRFSQGLHRGKVVIAVR
jgi:NADPH:quinone reductase-like Zn-dependent oxidoreductase